MKVTHVHMKRVITETKLVGIASVTLDDLFVIHDIKILKDGNGGFFFAMPSKSVKNEGFKDIVHPISAPARGVLEGILFTSMAQMMAENLMVLDLVCKNESGHDEFLKQTVHDFEQNKQEEPGFANAEDKDEILAWLKS